jgi:hypothetical protein
MEICGCGCGRLRSETPGPQAPQGPRAPGPQSPRAPDAPPWCPKNSDLDVQVSRTSRVSKVLLLGFWWIVPLCALALALDLGQRNQRPEEKSPVATTFGDGGNTVSGVRLFSTQQARCSARRLAHAGDAGIPHPILPSRQPPHASRPIHLVLRRGWPDPASQAMQTPRLRASS